MIAPLISKDKSSMRPYKRSCHALLVDDHEASTYVMGLHLDQFGCTYDVAHNGRDALLLLSANAYAVVLMDIKMPDMDGYELVRLIRKHEQEFNKPSARIIAVTAMASVGDRQHCLDCGMDDYIAKPFTPDILRTKLNMDMRDSGAFEITLRWCD